MDVIVDLSTATPDQSFMLMLCERVEKLEEELAGMKAALAPKEPAIAPCAMELYNRLCDIYASHGQKQQEDDKKRVEGMVPDHILAKVPKNSIKGLLDAISNNVFKHSFAAYFAKCYLEGRPEMDEEFVAWYTKALGL